jgi:hypothetical protein
MLSSAISFFMDQLILAICMWISNCRSTQSADCGEDYIPRHPARIAVSDAL